MKRFKYRLEKVLDFKTAEKKEKERQLAEENYKLRMREERLKRIMEAQEEVKANEVATMAEVELQGRYLEFLRQALVNQRLLIIEAAEAVNKARDAYLEKAIETETLETHRERRLEEYNEEKKRNERKELSELVTQRHRLTKEKG